MKPIKLASFVVLLTNLALIAASSMPVPDIVSSNNSTQEEEDDDPEENWQIWPSGIVPYSIDVESFGKCFSYWIFFHSDL